MYRVEIASSRVEKQILILPRQDRNKVAERILQLENESRPLGITKLKENIYRLRIGKYRVIYEVDDEKKVVIVTKVDKRRESTYKRIG